LISCRPLRKPKQLVSMHCGVQTPTIPASNLNGSASGNRSTQFALVLAIERWFEGRRSSHTGFGLVRTPSMMSCSGGCENMAEQRLGADGPQRTLFWPFVGLFPVGRRSSQACVPCMLSCSGVQVPCPGGRGAEGQGKRKGVLVRERLKAAGNEEAGRGTRTGYEVWYARDEWARNHKVLHPPRGVLYKSGAYASTV
jgi:hypothetical protein